MLLLPPRTSRPGSGVESLSAGAGQVAAVTTPTVLVVDDDDDTRAAICELLRDDGYVAIGLEDGQQAHDYLSRQPAPACVVLDLWMPNLDGWSLAGEVLGGRLPKVPLIVVTAAPSHFGYPVPVAQVMRKPFSPDRLLALLAKLVSRKSSDA
jgi:CheY-like chemotaxis protein